MRNTILWVDDDEFGVSSIAAEITDLGYRVVTARSVAEAKRLIASGDVPFSGCILDVMMPLGSEEGLKEAKGGHESGLWLGRWIRSEYPDVALVGHSVVSSQHVVSWFRKRGHGFVPKSAFTEPRETARQLVALLNGDFAGATQVFLVHGWDTTSLSDLRRFLRRLGFHNQLVLSEQAPASRTIIESLEAHTASANIIFALLTPDESYQTETGHKVVRARQNVIFEIGYLLGRWPRSQGGLIILYKEPVDIPSDLSGVVYIDISNGLASAEDLIRSELQRLLPHLAI